MNNSFHIHLPECWFSIIWDEYERWRLSLHQHQKEKQLPVCSLGKLSKGEPQPGFVTLWSKEKHRSTSSSWRWVTFLTVSQGSSLWALIDRTSAIPAAMARVRIRLLVCTTSPGGPEDPELEPDSIGARDKLRLPVLLRDKASWKVLRMMTSRASLPVSNLGETSLVGSPEWIIFAVLTVACLVLRATAMASVSSVVADLELNDISTTVGCWMRPRAVCTEITAGVIWLLPQRTLKSPRGSPVTGGNAVSRLRTKALHSSRSTQTRSERLSSR